MPGTDPRSARAKFCSFRVRDPKKFDKKSFRTKPRGKNVRITTACPKGKYNRRTEKCRVGVQLQTILKRKVRGKCPRAPKRR